MTRRRPQLAQEDGYTLVLVVFLMAALSLLAVTLLDLTNSESGRSARATTSSTAFQAAEAGIDDYIAKLLDDRLYYDHYVHAGESTRRSTSGTTATAGSQWTGGLAWTYPSGKDTWKQLDNGFDYNLQVYAPTATSPYIRIVATGRKHLSTTDRRAVEVLVRPSSIADFVMLSNDDVSYGSTAITTGKVYAGIDSNGVKHNVDHKGTARADVYAEGTVTGNPVLQNGAKIYTATSTPNIRDVIDQPVDFGNFSVSLVDVKRATDPGVGGLYLGSTPDAWKLTFLANGTVQVQACTKVDGKDVAEVEPGCGAATTYAVPPNGAIYSEVTAIIDGQQVNGRVTVASNSNIVVGDNLSYVQDGDDVLGLIGKNDVIVARWAPSVFNWRAAVLAQTGSRHSYDKFNPGEESHQSATFTGSTATDRKPYMNQFHDREYIYDATLLYLQPPWFPSIQGAYTIVSFREVTP